MKKIAAIAALIVAVGGAAGVVSQYRWWPWIWEFNALAAQTYKTAVTQQWDLLLVLQSRIAACEAQKKTADECRDLHIQEREREENIEDLEKKQKKLEE